MKDDKLIKEHTRNAPTIISAPSGARYLGQFMDELPNGILNKKETGCGATSVVLENKQNVIVCCPTIQLIKSKLSQYPGQRCPFTLLGVMKGVSAEDIETYVKRCDGKQPVKIMTTYDSYPRVAAVIGENLKNYKIVIDEYQELLDCVIYRNKAVKNLINNLKGQANVTYLSATPISYQYMPEELSELPQYEIEWPDSVRIIPHRVQTNSPFSKAVDIIKQHQAGISLEFAGHKVEEYFFFVNSVTAIYRIIKAAGLKPHEVKIICANTPINRQKLSGLKINNVTDPSRIFTFCTKTVFYGADFYSKAGICIIVSDGWIRSSSLDIATDIQQIAGRIRNDDNPFKHTILHIYNTGEWMSRCEFEEEMAKRLDSAKTTIAAFDELEVELRSAITTKIRTNDPQEFAYYNETKNCVELDTLKIAHLQHKFAAVDEVYTNGISIRDAYVKAGFNVEEAETWEQNLRNCVSVSSSLSKFGGLYRLYSEERKKMSIGKTDLAEDIEFQNDIIPLAYNYLGDEEVEKLKYDEVAVRRMVHYKMPGTQVALKKYMKEVFKLNKSYSLAEIKLFFARIFEMLRIEIKPKASLLADYYAVKKVKIRDDQGKRIDGYLLMDDNKMPFCFFVKSERLKFFFLSNFFRLFSYKKVC